MHMQYADWPLRWATGLLGLCVACFRAVHLCGQQGRELLSAQLQRAGRDVACPKGHLWQAVTELCSLPFLVTVFETDNL